MNLRHVARKIFIGTSCGLVGATFAEMSLGSVMRASDGLGANAFLSAIPFGIAFAASAYLLQALRENRRNALVFSFIALIATIAGRFIFYTPAEIGTTIADLAVTFSIASFALLAIAILIGEYPLHQDQSEQR